MIDILDTSVVVKWFCPEEPASTAAASRFLDLVKVNPRGFAVPELLFSECCHVFNRKFANDVQRVTWALDCIFRLSIRPLHVDDAVVEQIILAMSHGLSGYDATYYAFAVACEGRWITFDTEAAKLVPDQKYVHVPK